MPQIIACPFCQQQFTIAEDQYAGYANSQVTCSSCHKTFSIIEQNGALKAVDPSAAPPIAMPYAAPQQGPQSNGLAIAGLICGIAGFPTCGLAGIAGLICSILGLKKSSETGTGRGLSIAGIVLSVISMLAIPALAASIMLPSLARAREKANQVKCASNMRQIGQAVLMYSVDNRGYVPPDLSYLAKYLSAGNVYTCPSSSGPATTSGSITTDYIYLGQPGQRINQQRNPAGSVLLYEPLSDHSGEGANFLFYDGHAEFIDKRTAAPMIKQLEQGANPPAINVNPGLPEQ